MSAMPSNQEDIGATVATSDRMPLANDEAGATVDLASVDKRTRMRRLATIATGIATGAAILVVAFSIDLSKILPTLQQLHATTIAVATVLLVINFLLAFFRFERTLSALGASINRRVAAYAFSLGTLAGQFLLNIVGQSLTRAMVMQSTGVPMGVTVVATYLERLIGLGTLGAATVVAVFVLFGSVGFELHQGGAYFLSLGIGLSATLGIAGGRAVISAVTPDGLRNIVSTIPRLTPTLILSLLVHISMLAAYLVLTLDLAPSVDLTRLVAAVVVVMFAAGMPISWAGWGLREFSAVYAFNAVGVPSEAAVIVAVTIGTLSLLIALIGGSAAVMDGWRRSIPRAAPKGSSSGSVTSADAVLFWPIGILAACLIFFQLRVPTGSGEIMLNVADPLAITAFFFAAYMAWRAKFLRLFPASVVRGIYGLAMVLILGAFVAWLHLGLTQWALINRLLGFLILVGYAAIAGLVVLVSGERGRAILAKAFVTSAVLICAIEFVAYVIHLYVVALPLDFFGYQFKFEGQLEGYAQNPNAFAFQLLMAVCVFIAFRTPHLHRAAIPWSVLGGAVILVVVVITRSRAGILCGLAVGSLAILLRYLPRSCSINRKWLAVFAVALVIVIVTGFEFRSSINEFVIEPFNERWRTNADASDALRLETTIAAFQQWWQYPIFGHGLGSFLVERQRAGLSPLVIHSVPAWFLAEMGLVGLSGYVFFAAALLSWGTARIRENTYARGVVGAVALFLLMGLVHDIFFQRTFWFGIGLMLATTRRSEHEPVPQLM